MKLGWDVFWVDLYQSRSKNYDISKNMAARGGIPSKAKYWWETDSEKVP